MTSNIKLIGALTLSVILSAGAASAQTYDYGTVPTAPTPAPTSQSVPTTQTTSAGSDAMMEGTMQTSQSAASDPEAGIPNTGTANDLTPGVPNTGGGSVIQILFLVLSSALVAAMGAVWAYRRPV